MDPVALRAAFRVAVLVLVVALAILPFEPAGSAEFVVTVLAGTVGIVFVGLVALIARISSARPPNAVDRPRDLRSNLPSEPPGRNR